MVIPNDIDNKLLEKFRIATSRDNNIEELFNMLTIRDKPIDLEFTSKIYNTVNSMAQKNRNNRGKVLENIVEDFLTEIGIPFLRQVSHDKKGNIQEKKIGCVHDIVIDAKIGDNLKEKIVVSCKTSIRERYKQDGIVPCNKLYLVTIDRVSLRNIEKSKDMGIYIISVGFEESFRKMLENIQRSLTIIDVSLQEDVHDSPQEEDTVHN